MGGIPLTNGRYVDAAASSTNGNVRAWGQKDMTARQAFLWIDNSTHTWYNVVSSPGSIVNQSATITVNLGQANAQYTVSWWNTYTGQVSSTQTLTAGGDGVLYLSVSNLSTDTAVKITPVGVPYGSQAQGATPLVATALSATTSSPSTAKTAKRTAPTGETSIAFVATGAERTPARTERASKWLTSWPDTGDLLIGRNSGSYKGAFSFRGIGSDAKLEGLLA